MSLTLGGLPQLPVEYCNMCHPAIGVQVSFARQAGRHDSGLCQAKSTARTYTLHRSLLLFLFCAYRPYSLVLTSQGW